MAFTRTAVITFISALMFLAIAGSATAAPPPMTHDGTCVTCMTHD